MKNYPEARQGAFNRLAKLHRRLARIQGALAEASEDYRLAGTRPLPGWIEARLLEKADVEIEMSAIRRRLRDLGDENPIYVTLFHAARETLSDEVFAKIFAQAKTRSQRPMNHASPQVPT